MTSTESRKIHRLPQLGFTYSRSARALLPMVTIHCLRLNHLRALQVVEMASALCAPDIFSEDCSDAFNQTDHQRVPHEERTTSISNFNTY